MDFLSVEKGLERNSTMLQLSELFIKHNISFGDLEAKCSNLIEKALTETAKIPYVEVSEFEILLLNINELLGMYRISAISKDSIYCILDSTVSIYCILDRKDYPLLNGILEIVGH